VRYTTYLRSILERAARSGSPPELAEITERLERIERALSAGSKASEGSGNRGTGRMGHSSPELDAAVAAPSTSSHSFVLFVSR
jgi:hypothetical protein